MTEALLNNERCFLEQDAWRAVLRSVILDDELIADRSEIVIELMILKSNIPGFFVDVTNIIYHHDPDRTHINAIACKIHQLRVDLLKWHSNYEFSLSCAPAIYPGSAEYDRRCKVFATYLSCLIISSRLLGAISPTERVELEEETQVLAGRMLDLEIEVKSTSSAACMFMAQTLGVSQATIATSEDWLHGEILRNGSRSGSGSGSEQLQIEKLESISPEGFTSETPPSNSPPSASLSSEGCPSDGPPSATLSSEEFSSEGFASVGFSSTAPSSAESDHASEPRGLIERWKLDRWCAKFGRKMPS
jgi:hypothetical protein